MNRIICVVNDSAIPHKGLKHEHGLALWIETQHGVVLFDTGQSGTVLLHNMEKLGLNIKDVDKLVLSHAHYDHTGGAAAVFENNEAISVYAHPDIFRGRYSYKNGKYHFIGTTLAQDIPDEKVPLILSWQPLEVFPDLWTSGEITAREEVEGRSNHHFVEVDGQWQPDPYRDDLSLILKTQKGLVLICGCCHAGLLNTISHVQHAFREPIVTIIGGTHLGTMDGDTMDHIIAVLKQRFTVQPNYCLNHCSGENARLALKKAFNERVEAFPAGTTLIFD